MIYFGGGRESVFMLEGGGGGQLISIIHLISSKSTL